jgi:hypothetical protein
MPTLDDLPTLSIPASLTGDDLLPLYDLTATGSSKVRKVPLGYITGAGASDVTVFGDTSAVQSASAPVATTTAISGGSTYQVTSVALPTTVGYYASVPAVTVSGGSPTTAAVIVAVLSNGTYGSIVGFSITTAGVYTTATAPTLAIAASTVYTQISSRVSFGVAATSKLNLPPVSGLIRDVRVIKSGAGTCDLYPHPADGIASTIIYSGASTSAASTVQIASTGTATLLSNGTNWYRVH